MPASDEFLTVAKIAAELKMNEQTIRNWIFSTGSDVAAWPD
jgi:predicted transcriptional regulator